MTRPDQGLLTGQKRDPGNEVVTDFEGHPLEFKIAFQTNYFVGF